MLQSFKAYIHKTLFKTEYDRNQELIVKYKAKIETIKKQNTQIQLYETMLANKNAAATIAQSIYVTDHAVHRYIERVNNRIQPEEARKLLYKRTLALLKTLDKLPDGNYEITKDTSVRIKDNTVCTVIKRK